MSSSGEPAPVARRPLRQRTAVRALRVVGLLAVALLLALWAALESRPAAERVRTLLQARLASALGTEVRIGALALDVLPFRLEIDGLYVAGPRPDRPRADVRRMVVQIGPWGLLQRRIVVDELELDRPLLDLTLGAGDRGSGPALPLQLVFRRVRVREGTLRFAHLTAGFDGRLEEVALELAPETAALLPGRTVPAVGSLRVGGGRLDLSARNGAGAVLAPLEIDVRFGLAGPVARVDSLRVTAGQSTISGRGVVRGTSGADLELEGDIALHDLFHVWVPPGPDDHAGRAAFRGSLQIRDGSPVLSGHLLASAARMSGVPIERFAGQLQLHAQLVALRDVHARVFGGRLDGDLVVDRREQPARIDIRYDADGLDATALSAWAVLPGWRTAGALGGTGTLSWSQPFRQTASGRGELRLHLPDLGGGEAPAAPAAPPESESASAAAVAGGGRSSAGPVPSLPLVLDGHLRYSLAQGTLALEDLALEMPRSRVRANGRIDLDGALLLALEADSRDLRMLDHLVAQYRAFRAGSPSAPRLGLRGGGAARLRVGGTVAAPAVSGVVQFTDMALADLAIGTGSATVTTSADGYLVARPLRVQRGEGTLTGEARVRLPSTALAAGADEYDLALQLRRYALVIDLPVGGREARLRAAAEGLLRMRGPLGAVRAAEWEITLAQAALDAPGPARPVDSAGSMAAEQVRTARLLLRGSREGDTWRIERLEAEALGGRLTGAGDWTRGPAAQTARTMTGSLHLQADAVDAAAVGAVAAALLGAAPPLQGTVSLVLDAAGPIDRLDARLRGSWNGATLAGAPLGDVQLQADARMGALSLSLRGAVGTEAPAPWSLTADSRVDAPDRFTASLDVPLAALPPLLGARVAELAAGTRLAGRLTGWIRGHLGDPASWTAEGAVSGLEIARGAFAAAAERVDLAVRDEQLTVRGALVSGGGPATLNLQVGLRDGALSGSVSGSVDLAGIGLFARNVAFAGTATGAVRLAGTLAAPTFTGELRANDLAVAGTWPYAVSGGQLRAELLGDRIALESLTGTVAGRPFRVEATLPLAALAGLPSGPPVRLHGRITQLPLDPWLERSEGVRRLVTGGVLDAEVTLEGRGHDWRLYRGEMALQQLSLGLSGYAVELDHAVRATLTGGVLRLPEDVRLVGSGTALQLSGSVALAPLELDLRARGRVGFEPLNVLSPSWGTGGVADVDLRIAGNVPDLGYFGTAELRDVVLSPPPLRQPIEEIRAHLSFENRRVRIDSAEGRVGGGSLRASGELFLQNSVPRSFRFAFTLENATLRVEPRVTVKVNAELVHDGTPKRSLLSGRIELLEGRYRRILEADDALLELLEAPETEPDPLLTAVDLDVRVDGTRNLFIDNNLADVEVNADFELRGTLAEPVVLGRSRILRGRLFWNGNTFEVLQGTVELNNPFRTEPVFEIRARTEIRRYTIDLNLSGSFERGMTFTYTSTPPLSDLDVFNLLAFGEEPNSAVLTDPLAYQRALGLQATRYLAEAYLSEVERGAERVFGVDRFRLSPTLSGSETDATARLTVGKRINRNVYVTYSRLLSSTEDQLLTVEYQVTPEIRLKGTRDEDGSFGIDLLVQRRIR